MSGHQSLTQDVDIDLKGMLGAVWRKLWLIALIAVASAVVIYILSSFIAPRFKADAQILISKQESVFTRVPNEPSSNGSESDERWIMSQVLIINSDDLASRVIKELNLENHPDFQKKKSDPGLLKLAASYLETSAEAGIENNDGNVAVNPGVLAQFKEQLTVYTPDKSRVAVVEFWSTDRKLAMQVPNALSRLYIEFTKSERLETERNATEFLGPEIDELRGEVRGAEQKVAEFRASSDILLGNNNALLATQQLSEISSELSRVRSENSSAEARIETIRNALRSGSSLEVIPEVIASPLIQRLREREIQLKGAISELSTTLLPNHPRIKSLQSQLPEIDRQIRLAAENIIDSLENNVELSRKQEAALIQDLNRLKAEAARAGEAEVQLRALEREAAAQRERLENYLRRFNEATSRQSSGYTPSEARIIEHATLPPKSFFPKKGAFTVAGSTGVAVLAIIAVLMAELFSGRAFKPVDNAFAGPVRDMAPERVQVSSPPPMQPTDQDLLSDALPIPIEDTPVAYEPEEYLTPTVVQPNSEMFPFADATQAIMSLGNGMVVVVAPDVRAADELSRSSATEMARQLADEGFSTALVDMTLEGETAKKILQTPDLPGLCQVLAGETTLREALYEDPSSQLHILPSGGDRSKPNFSNLPKLVTTLKEVYDFVIFDCGSPTVKGIAKIADAETIVLVAANRSVAGMAQELSEELVQNGFEETIVINAIEVASPHTSAA